MDRDTPEVDSDTLEDCLDPGLSSRSPSPLIPLTVTEQSFKHFSAGSETSGEREEDKNVF